MKYTADNVESGYTAAANAGKTETFGYDAAGNRNASTATGSASLSYSVNETNQYTSISDGSTPTYNARGDFATYDGWTYSYTAAGNLVKGVKGSSTLEYLYDGFGNRVAEKQGSETTWLLHLGRTPLEAYKSMADTQTSYIHSSGIDTPVAQVLNGGAVEFMYQDVNGNVVLLSSASGSILEAYRYGVWGDVRVFNAAGGQLITAPKSRFLFTGRDYDAEMGLYHSRTRAYSPKLGRFMQIDSVDFSGDDLNLYRYCMNNPLNYRDPFGTNPFKDLMDKIKKWCGVGQNGEQFEKDMKDLGESVDNYNETAADSYDKFMDPNITPEEFNQAVDDVKDAARDVSGRAGDAAGSGSKIPGQISGGKTP